MAKGKKKRTQFLDKISGMGENDPYGAVYDSMLKSRAYQKLSTGAKAFFTVCKVHARTEEARRCLYNHKSFSNREYDFYDFVFPAAQLEKYGYDKSNATKLFKQLINAGLIELREPNKPIYKTNVYRFSDKWKTME